MTITGVMAIGTITGTEIIGVGIVGITGIVLIGLLVGIIGMVHLGVGDGMVGMVPHGITGIIHTMVDTMAGIIGVEMDGMIVMFIMVVAEAHQILMEYLMEEEEEPAFQMAQEM